MRLQLRLQRSGSVLSLPPSGSALSLPPSGSVLSLPPSRSVLSLPPSVSITSPRARLICHSRIARLSWLSVRILVAIKPHSTPLGKPLNGRWKTFFQHSRQSHQITSRWSRLSGNDLAPRSTASTTDRRRMMACYDRDLTDGLAMLALGEVSTGANSLRD